MSSDRPSRPTVAHRRRGSIGNLIRRLSTAIRPARSSGALTVDPSQSASASRTVSPSRPRMVPAVASDSIVPTTDVKMHSTAQATEPARPIVVSRTRTAPAVSKPIPAPEKFATIRIRRSCHVCGNLFIHHERVCQDCEHVMCSRCPRDPPRLSRSTSSPPGEDQHAEAIPPIDDVLVSEGEDPTVDIGTIRRTRQPESEQQYRHREYKKPRHRIRYICDKCGTVFDEKSRVCRQDGCGHKRCENCPREPPKRRPPTEHDPEVVRKLEARMATYFVVQQTAAAAATTVAAASAAASTVEAGIVPAEPKDTTDTQPEVVDPVATV